MLVLAFEHAPIRRQFDMGGNDAIVADALREVLGVEWTVQTVGAEASEPVLSAAAAEGFAPGDAPTEDADGGTADANDAATGPDAAISLLEAGLGAQVIGEIDAS